MSYTTATLSDVGSFDDLVSPPAGFRPVALGVTVIGCGILGTALVVTAMTATSMLLDSLSSAPKIWARGPAAPPPAVVASRQGQPEGAPSPAPAPMATEPGRTPGPGLAAKPSPAAPAHAPPVAAAPSVAAAPPVAGTAPLPPVRDLPDLALPPVAGGAPLPPVRPAPGVLPLAPLTTTPGSPLAAVTATPSEPPPPVIAAASVVPLPPKRPSIIPEGVPAPAPETSLPSAARPNRGVVHSSPGESTQQKLAVAPEATASPARDNRNIFQKFFDALKGSPAPSRVGSRTAVYDISSHTVVLPDGERLEAHSGLGSRFDDPRSGSDRNVGVTPPHLYQLSLRQQLFHGVAALRLNPVGDGTMYGRVGMLAHSYMLGSRGESNGCVSFKNYAKFLRAYQSGEVTHLVVVAHASDAPMSVASASGRAR